MTSATLADGIRAQRERILNAWAGGIKGADIARKEGMRKHEVFRVVHLAKADGDPRAITRHGDKDKGEVSTTEFFSRGQLQSFDLAFKTAMLSAMSLGLESPAMGVVKCAKGIKVRRA